jgi:hypothetical protein
MINNMIIDKTNVDPYLGWHQSLQDIYMVTPSFFDSYLALVKSLDQLARKMYGTDLPKPIRLLEAGARVCKKHSLLFFLLGPVNYQWHPKGTRRIAYIDMTVVPTKFRGSKHKCLQELKDRSIILNNFYDLLPMLDSYNIQDSQFSDGRTSPTSIKKCQKPLKLCLLYYE